MGGDDGECMYLIESGSVDCTKSNFGAGLAGIEIENSFKFSKSLTTWFGRGLHCPTQRVAGGLVGVSLCRHLHVRGASQPVVYCGGACCDLIAAETHAPRVPLNAALQIVRAIPCDVLIQLVFDELDSPA